MDCVVLAKACLKQGRRQLILQRRMLHSRGVARQRINIILFANSHRVSLLH